MIPLILMENAITPSQTSLMAVRTDPVCSVSCEVSQLTQTRRSPLLVGMEDIVLVLHRQMACVPAVSGSRIGCKLIGPGIIVEQGVSPAAGVWKSLAVLLD